MNSGIIAVVMGTVNMMGYTFQHHTAVTSKYISYAYK